MTTKVVSSNPVHGEVYSIQLYVIKFVSDLRQVGGFLRVLWFPPPRYNWNIVESGPKHHKPNQKRQKLSKVFLLQYIIYLNTNILINIE